MQTPHNLEKSGTAVLELRVRYSETDQMGTFYNARALEWFECGRSEWIRARLGLSYAALEDKGVFLPLVEAHLDFKGTARYDDLLRVETRAAFTGRARFRFDVKICHLESGAPVVSGYTVHAFASKSLKPIRPPGWLIEMIEKAAQTT